MTLVGEGKIGIAYGGKAISVPIKFFMRGQQEVQRGLLGLRGAFRQFRGIVTQASITTFVFSMLMRRQSQTARRLQTVQENTAETIRKYGRFSLEARQALRQLEQAQENAKFAQIEFALQTIFAASSIITLMYNIADLIARLGLLEAKYWSVAAAKIAALGPIGLLAVAGGALVGGIVIGKIAFGGGESDSEFDQQWDQAGRYVQRERRRQRR